MLHVRYPSISLFAKKAAPLLQGNADYIRYFNVRCISSTLSNFHNSNEKETAITYTDTLLLPKTSFPLRPSVERESVYREKITRDLYKWQRDNVNGKEFILHDGPPFANGSPHMGHALNKMLKDFINRYHLLNGRKVHYKPGWDCHGLPLEHIVTRNGPPITGNTDLKSILQVRDACRALAIRSKDIQKKEFEEWGVLGDWGDGGTSGQIYLTMDAQYEAAQLEVFWRLYSSGKIYRAEKPVYWSPATQTALAEAELEYEMHTSLSAYFSYPVLRPSTSLQAALSTIPATASTRIRNEGIQQSVHCLAWTTTPWTIPASRAVCVHPEMEYCLVDIIDDKSGSHGEQAGEIIAGEEPGDGQGLYIVAKSRVSSLSSLLSNAEKGAPKKNVRVVAEGLKGSDLKGTECEHPLYPFSSTRRGGGVQVPILCGAHVTDESGTGLVHTAPGHGMEDFLVCQENNIPSFSSVNAKGELIEECGEELRGRNVLGDASQRVVEILGRNLLHTHHYEHKYPHDWRSKTPVIIRSTSQWFANIDSLKAAAVDTLDDVEVTPAVSKSILSRVVQSRSDWCISRSPYLMLSSRKYQAVEKTI